MFITEFYFKPNKKAQKLLRHLIRSNGEFQSNKYLESAQ